MCYYVWSLYIREVIYYIDYPKEQTVDHGIKMYLCIVILPLLGSFVAGLFGRFVGPTGASLVTTSCLYLTLFFSCVCFYEVGLCGSPCHIHAGE